MPLEAGTVVVAVEADMSRFGESAAEGIQQATSGAGSKLGEWGKTIGVLAGGAFALNFGRKGLEAFETLEKGTERLRLGLEAVGTDAAKSLDSVLDWARDFSLQTGINESAIVDMTSRLVSMGTAFFTAVGPQADEMLQLLVEDLNDMASATGQTAARLMRTLGPALLNAPAKAIPILQKYGGITDEVADRVRNLADQGKNTQASIILLNAIEQKWGGTTAKLATPLDRLKNMVNLLEQNVGSLISPIVGVIAAMGEWALKNQGLVQTIGGGVGILYLISKLTSLLDKLANTKVVTYLAQVGEGLAEAGANSLDTAANIGQLTGSTLEAASAAGDYGESLSTVSDVATTTSGAITAAQVAQDKLKKATEAATVVTSKWALVGKGLLATLVKYGPYVAAAAVAWYSYSKVVDSARKFTDTLTKSLREVSQAIADGKKNRDDLDAWLQKVLGPKQVVPKPETNPIVQFIQAIFGADPVEDAKFANQQLDAFGDHAVATAVNIQKAALAAAQYAEGQRTLWESSFSQASTFVDHLGGKITALSDATGISFGDISSSVRLALAHVAKSFANGHKDLEGWKDFVASTMQSAREEINRFQEAATESLNFVDDKFSEVASDFKGSSEDIAAALRTSLEKQKLFAADLQTIMEDGGAGAKILVQQLLALGPAGANAAHKIATGSEDARHSIESSLAAGQRFAEDTATVLSRKIVGVLTDIRNILHQIARTWGLKITADTSQAEAAIQRLYNSMVAAGVDPNSPGLGQLIKVERESFVPDTATGGIVTTPQIRRVGEAGPEAIIPLSRMNSEPRHFVVDNWKDGSGHFDDEMAWSDIGRG